MAQLHHASWHLLRQHKQKARYRRHTKATDGAQRRKFEQLSIQCDAALARAKQAEADTQTMYAAMQSAQLKVEA